MKNIAPIITIILFIAASCTSQQKLAYFNNLPETGGEELFTMEIPDYMLQPRDVLYITAKAMTPEGKIMDFLSTQGSYVSTGSSSQVEPSGFYYGYEINYEGNIILPAVGEIKVIDLSLDQARKLLQEKIRNVFKDAIIECKLLSYKFTVIGEVRSPGAYVNYTSYLTVLEAIGRAGGIGDYGRRDKVLVVRPTEKGTKTYNLNLQDKNLLSSEAYFLLPNDVIIVEPLGQKIFNLNLPIFSFILVSFTSALTTTLLLIDYFENP